MTEGPKTPGRGRDDTPAPFLGVDIDREYRQLVEVERGYRRLTAWAYIEEGILRLERYANGGFVNGPDRL